MKSTGAGLRERRGRAEENAGVGRGIGPPQAKETRICFGGETKRYGWACRGRQGHCRRRRGTIGGFKKVSVRWARWERNPTLWWREGVVYSMGAIYHTLGLANERRKRQHSFCGVVFRAI